MNGYDIGHRRVIEHIELDNTHGEIVLAGGRRFTLTYDDLLDLAQATELLVGKVSGKMLAKHVLPKVTRRDCLRIEKLRAWSTTVAAFDKPAHAMRVELVNGDAWDNEFLRLDELVRLLYAIIADAQRTAAMKAA